MRLSSSGLLFVACLLFVSCGGEPGNGGGGGGTTDGTGGGTGMNGGGTATGGGDMGTGGAATGGGPSSGGGAATGGGTATGGGSGTTGGGQGGGNVTIIVEPSDNAAALKAAITNATTSVHMTMYLLSSSPIINALIAQKQAGHEVKVLLNQNLPTGDGSNGAVFNQLVQAGVDVRWAPSTFTLTHEKCVIIDNSTAWIMTMNATASAPTSNREYLAIDTKPADVAEAENVFEADFSNTTANTTGSLLVAPVNARARIVALIGTASSRVDMEAEELSDYQVVGALSSAKMRGATVHVVLSDVTPTASQTSSVMQLKTAGVELVSVHTPYIHAKTVIADGQQAYVGSENFTTSSLQYNRELGVFVTDSAEVQKILTATNTDFSNGTAL